MCPAKWHHAFFAIMRASFSLSVILHLRIFSIEIFLLRGKKGQSAAAKAPPIEYA
jgi:hypothetical protein